jgi:diguanylate cyclase (GGDEF)-like protein
VNKTPDSNENAAKPASAPDALQPQAEQPPGLPIQLRDEDAPEHVLSDSKAAQLVEANEQLIVAALRAQGDAEAAAAASLRLSRAAELDALTELPNRVLLLDRLAQAIMFAKRQNTRLALLFLDLDNFKRINDTLGHAVGDQALKVAGRRLASAIRGADTVSRHGGDEFLILLSAVSQASDAVVIARKIAAELGAPARVGSHVLRLTASIGISLYPDDGDDADTLINRADAAMYRAKKSGLSGFAFHEELPHQRTVPPPPLASLQSPFTDYASAMAEHERRHAQLQEANEQLVLAALTAQELQAAAEHAHQRQTDFVVTLAHELRNPLVPIRTAAAVLGGISMLEQLPPRMQAIIERQVAHMSRLVDDLLDTSRVSTGKLRLERREIELVSIIDAAVDTCRPAMDARLQNFIVQLPSSAAQMLGDPIRLTQILCNLLDNASKYTPEGGEIRLSMEVVDDSIVMTVSDNGIGIAADVLPRIFEPFVQDAHAVGFNGAGLGIGLTVVRELVQAHGGNVVASSPGAGLGSQFAVSLPMAPPPAIQPD